ncbi:hypothetical protein N9A94_06100 [Akkermansiaceae bacterium]|nr:hypothetical protein [Akkermansiaceae bacterium]MDB4537755.1 hypothetical protein [Akkermansiaceae bacterium]
MKKTLKFALTAVLLAAAPFASAKDVDCVKVSDAVKAAVIADSNKVLEIVATQVAANESCACEIVKAAIVASDADKKTVALIVDTAILEAPDQLRIIAQCAIAIAPDAISKIQAVVEKYDKAGGEGHSEKGGLSKDAISAVVNTPNPLDFPGGSSDSGNPVGVGDSGDSVGSPRGEVPPSLPGLLLAFPPVPIPPSITTL